MVWRIELSTLAQKDLRRLDPQIVERLLRFLHDRVAKLDEPRVIGQALKGSALGEFWKYRVGDDRIVSRIEDGALRVLVIRIGHRKDVFDRA